MYIGLSKCTSKKYFLVRGARPFSTSCFFLIYPLYTFKYFHWSLFKLYRSRSLLKSASVVLEISRDSVCVKMCTLSVSSWKNHWNFKKYQNYCRQTFCFYLFVFWPKYYYQKISTGISKRQHSKNIKIYDSFSCLYNSDAKKRK